MATYETTSRLKGSHSELCYLRHAATEVHIMNTTDTQPGHSRFEPNPKTRGTLNILWGSLFAILACTWTIQHLNVPEQRVCCKPGWKGALKWHTKKFKTKAQWMLITIIAPEIVIGMACYDLLAAKMTSRILQRFALEVDILWTLNHSYFANMGGFVIASSTSTGNENTLLAELEFDTPQHAVHTTSNSDINEIPSGVRIISLDDKFSDSEDEEFFQGLLT